MAKTLSSAQLSMLRALKRAVDYEEKNHGHENAWEQLSAIVMDAAPGLGPDSLAWTNANAVFGALERRGLIEFNPTNDDLIRPSVKALELLAVQS